MKLYIMHTQKDTEKYLALKRHKRRYLLWLYKVGWAENISAPFHYIYVYVCAHPETLHFDHSERKKMLTVCPDHETNVLQTEMTKISSPTKTNLFTEGSSLSITLKRNPQKRQSNIKCLHQSNSKNPLEKKINIFEKWKQSCIAKTPTK